MQSGCTCTWTRLSASPRSSCAPAAGSTVCRVPDRSLDIGFWAWGNRVGGRGQSVPRRQRQTWVGEPGPDLDSMRLEEGVDGLFLRKARDWHVPDGGGGQGEDGGAVEVGLGLGVPDHHPPEERVEQLHAFRLRLKSSVDFH
eukprot:2342682-Rhodomonas_salina.3